MEKKREQSRPWVVSHTIMNEVKGSRTWLRAPVLLDLINEMGAAKLIEEVEREVQGPAPQPEAEEPSEMQDSMAGVADDSGGDDFARGSAKMLPAKRPRVPAASSGSSAGNAGGPTPKEAAAGTRRTRARVAKTHVVYVPWDRDTSPAVQVKRGGPMSLPGFKCLPFSEWPDCSFKTEVLRWRKFMQKTKVKPGTSQ